MKPFNFLSMVVASFLMLAAVGCTTMRTAEDSRYERAGQDRIYVNDPYRGTIVLERDPYTGRYYEVNSIGYSSPYSRYGYDDYYRRNDRYYRRYNHGSYNSGNQNPPQPTDQQIRDREKNKAEARKKILGN